MVKHTEDLDSIHSTHTDLIPFSDLTGHVYDVQTCRENNRSKEGGKEGGRGGERKEGREGGKAGQKFIKPTSAKHTNLKLKNNIMKKKWVLKGPNALKSQKQSWQSDVRPPGLGEGGQFMEDLTFFPRPPERYSIQIEGATHHLRSCLIPLLHFTYLTS